MEDRGVDEVYIDFTDVPGGQREGGRVLARLIQKSIFEATGLTCSIGVAPNKLLAKMASEFDKPNGISVVLRERPADAHLAAALPQGQRHRPQGRREAAAPRHPTPSASSRRGSATGWSRTSARPPAPGCTRWPGAATSGPVVTESEPVSMSRETTFDRDLHAVRDRAELGAIFTAPVREAGRGPAAQGLRRQDHRHQAALRRLQDRHARPDHRAASRPTRRPSAAPPASASSACRWSGRCGCWACAWARW